MEQDFYAILGVDAKATRDEIKRAYQLMAKKHHPDKGGDHDRMAMVVEAWECLQDPVRRAAYDKSGVNISNGSIQSEALDLVKKRLADALAAEALEFLNFAYESLSADRVGQESELVIVANKVAYLSSRRGKVKKSKPETTWLTG
jgi:DnaJ-class molecular chaperone